MDKKLSRIKRLQYQSWYRGCKETDILLGEYARAHLESLPEEAIDLYEDFMQEDDKAIFNWLTETEPVPDKYHAYGLFDSILAFHRS